MQSKFFRKTGGQSRCGGISIFCFLCVVDILLENERESRGSCENGELSCLFVCFLKNDEAKEGDTKKKREKFFVPCVKKKKQTEEKKKIQTTVDDVFRDKNTKHQPFE